MNQPLLQTVGLKKYYKVKAGELHAVDNINLSIQESQTLGVVGESGCGKTTLGRTILRLVPATSGQILFRGENILEYSGKQMHEMRRN
ncbi:MAG TPA: ATP-binding cassette domain-containing protein, partial [Anaerolineaceae bacterium]|nr:ATP-binding cassette domain-containing protein [Anaerolineaceae bacterium]